MLTTTLLVLGALIVGYLTGYNQKSKPQITSENLRTFFESRLKADIGQAIDRGAGLQYISLVYNDLERAYERLFGNKPDRVALLGTVFADFITPKPAQPVNEQKAA